MLEVNNLKSAVENLTGLKIELKEFDDGKGHIDVDSLLSNGWQMRDIPLVLNKFWDRMMNAMGEDNFYILSMTKRSFSDGDYTRGQLLISPNGFLGLKSLIGKVEDELEEKTF